jgi:hypothetical protein
MNVIDKLRSLQAGELDKVLEGTPFYAPEYNSTGRPANDSALAVDGCALFNAAKVEVTKVVLPVVIERFTALYNEARDEYMDDNAPKLVGANKALTLLQQLKESL